MSVFAIKSTSTEQYLSNMNLQGHPDRCQSKSFKFSLYAEYHLFIQSVTLYLVLPHEIENDKISKLSESLQGYIKDDLQTIVLTFGKQSYLVTLQHRVKLASAVMLPLLLHRETERIKQESIKEELFSELCVKISIADERLDYSSAMENIVPITASNLRQVSKILCCACHKDLINVKRITRWIDLPRDNWAEMMEFWHCHKPQPKKYHHNEHVKFKGYSADSKLRALSGTGMVSLTDILLRKEDCVGVKNKKVSGYSGSLVCIECQAEVGRFDEGADGFRFFKWTLQYIEGSISKGEYLQHSMSEINDKGKWIASILLTEVENQGERRFLVEAVKKSNSLGLKSGVNKKFLIWLFTPDLWIYTSKITECLSSERVYGPEKKGKTCIVRCKAIRAVKVFWREDDDIPESYAKLTLSDDLFGHLKLILEASNKLFPKSGRTYLGYRIGLIDRFGYARSDP